MLLLGRQMERNDIGQFCDRSSTVVGSRLEELLAADTP